MIEALRVMLEPSGIRIRGVFHCREGEGPELDKGGKARTVVLLGNIGGSIWEPFSHWRNTRDDGGNNPLDRWSEDVIGPVAEAIGAVAYFPSDKPWWPFQRWAKIAEGLEPSPLGLLIHPEYGLWHGYRGALGFAEEHEFPAAPRLPSPCSKCAKKPCLEACPAHAISEKGFDVPACRAFLAADEGQAGCVKTGCVARNACPVGSEYRYPAAQLAFHMEALDI